MNGEFVLPWFVTLPSGLLAMSLLVAHMGVLGRDEGMDATRQRIRQANGVVMMLLVPILIAGLSVVEPNRSPSAWVVAWTVCVFLVLVMIAMAMLDALNTVRIAKERRAELRRWLLQRHETIDD